MSVTKWTAKTLATSPIDVTIRRLLGRAKLRMNGLQELSRQEYAGTNGENDSRLTSTIRSWTG
jgi:hypothetical protein